MGYSGSVVTDLPDWTPPVDIIAEPPSDKKANGWQVEEYPPAQWRNWFDEGFYQSIKELDTEVGNIQDGTTTVGNSDKIDGKHLANIDWTDVAMSKTDSGIDADTYKGNDIDSNGDGQVDSADKVGGQIIPQERFQVSGTIGGVNENYTLNTGVHDLQRIYVIVPDNKSLVLKRTRLGLRGDNELTLKVDIFTTGSTFESSWLNGEDPHNFTLCTNTSGSSSEYILDIQVNSPSDGNNFQSGSGWWLEFSIE